MVGSIVVAAVVLTACGGSTASESGANLPSAPPAGGSAVASAATSVPGSGTPSASGSGPSGSSSGASVPIDPTLLAILPAQVGGIPVAAVPDPVATTDPDLAASVARMAQAYVVDPSTGDFAYASLIALRPEVFSADFYRSWRDSFDEGACSQAGGIAGHAETTVAGRTVAIGRCAGGVVTYHVRLDGPDVIVSVSSLGSSQLGAKMVAGLRP